MSFHQEQQHQQEHHFEREQLASIQEVFQFYDTCGDGQVRVDQLGLCLRSLGLCPTEAQVSQLVAGLEPEGRISLEQFVPMLHSVRKEGAGDRTEAQLTAFLEQLDREGAGCVSAAELRQVVTSCGEPLDEEEFEQLMAGRDQRDDGRLGILELVQALTK